MQGKILEYNNEKKNGLIRGDNGQKYYFSIDDLISNLRPSAGKDVDFEIKEESAIEIYILSFDTIDNINRVNSSVLKPSVEKIKKSKIPRTARNIIIFSAVFFIFSIVAVQIGDYIKIKLIQTKISQLRSECNKGNGVSCYKLADEYGGWDRTEFKSPSLYYDSLSIEETKEAYEKACQYGVVDGCLKK